MTSWIERETWARALFERYGFRPVKLTEDRSGLATMHNDKDEEFLCHAFIFDDGNYYIHFHEYRNRLVHLRSAEVNHKPIAESEYHSI